MHRLNFYKEEPSLVKKASYFLYGHLPLWSPVVINGMLFDGYYQLIGYGAIGAALGWEKSRKYLIEQYELFREKWLHHRLSCRLSEILRDVMLNANLVVKERRERVDRRGRKVVEDITTFPAVDLSMDDNNYYLQVHMLSGQTSKQWEGKLDSFAHALRCDLVKSKIERGIISLTLQHTPMNVTEVIRKNDDSHVIYLGYRPGGLLEWEFDLNPNLLVVGVVGAGKSTFVRTLLTQIPRNWTLRIVDGKQVEFSYMKDYGYDVVESKEDFLRYIDEAVEEMDRRYEYMSEHRKSHYTEVEGLEPYFLVCDEWISLVEQLEKKGKSGQVSERDAFFEKLKTLMTKGRAAGVFVIAILQRPDAEFLSGIVRDMFTCKVVLKGSAVAFKMAFDDQGKDLTPLGKGQGYCMIEEVTNFSFPNYTLDQFVADLEEKKRAAVVEDVQEESAMAREADLPSPIQ